MLYEVITGVSLNLSGFGPTPPGSGLGQDQDPLAALAGHDPLAALEVEEGLGRDVDPAAIVITSYSIHYTKLYDGSMARRASAIARCATLVNG